MSSSFPYPGWSLQSALLGPSGPFPPGCSSVYSAADTRTPPPRTAGPAGCQPNAASACHCSESSPSANVDSTEWMCSGQKCTSSRYIPLKNAHTQVKKQLPQQLPGPKTELVASLLETTAWNAPTRSRMFHRAKILKMTGEVLLIQQEAKNP